mmetsp:Transcript_12029/g.30463  ORF Transcript_12029/g.30463 Transcript_12029/m.30463 type:complete len:230 (+) Transcript_12029:166-855(+)
MANTNPSGKVSLTVQLVPATYEYLKKMTLRESDALRALRETLAAQPHAQMAASPDEAQFLAFLLPLMNAKKVIEVGVFKGYTTLAMAAALPADGKVVGLDVSDEYVSVARPFWKQAGVQDRIDVRIAPASDSMDQMLKDGEAGTYDLVFIDADKNNYDVYYEKGLQLLRVGGVVAIDNTLWDGRPAGEEKDFDEDTKAIHALNTKLRTDERVALSGLPLADGLTLCRKL